MVVDVVNTNEINALREKLNKLVISEVDYQQIYNLSVELDKLIIDYYKSSLLESRIVKV